MEKFEPPDDLHPVNRIGSSNTFIIDNTNSYIPPKQKITRTFEEYLQQINEYDKIMLTNVTILDMSTLIENITKEKKIIICSDGSTKENESGGAFVISDGDERLLVTGNNPDTAYKWFQMFVSIGGASMCSFIPLHPSHLFFLQDKKTQ